MSAFPNISDAPRRTSIAVLNTAYVVLQASFDVPSIFGAPHDTFSFPPPGLFVAAAWLLHTVSCVAHSGSHGPSCGNW
jgi:hypothetical protein